MAIKWVKKKIYDIQVSIIWKFYDSNVILILKIQLWEPTCLQKFEVIYSLQRWITNHYLYKIIRDFTVIEVNYWL